MSARDSEELYLAAARGDLAGAQVCLNDGADANWHKRNENRWTPLHQASLNGNADVVKMLLENGAKADATARQERTPLHWASQNGNVDIVKMLLEKGASADAASDSGESSLHDVSLFGHVHVAKVLIEEGANVNAIDEDKRTPLHWASQKGYVDIVKMLLEKGANTEAALINGETPLHLASEHGHVDAVKLLIEKGAKIHATEGNGCMPLHIASKHGQVDAVQLLIEEGANVNAASDDGWTPLHLASATDHVGAVKMLVDRGANVNATTSDGWTPLHLASQNDYVGAVKMLVERGANVNATNDVRAVETIERARVIWIKGGWAPLHIASRRGHVAVVDGLLAAGAEDFGITMDDSRPSHPLDMAFIGRTARDFAAANNLTAIVDALDKCAQDRALTCFCAGDHAKAEKFAALYVKATGLDKSAFAWIGDRLYHQGEFEQALRAFENGQRSDPTDVDCFVGSEDVKDTIQVATAFQQKDLFVILAKDHRMRDYMRDKAFATILKSVQANPTLYDRKNDRLVDVLHFLQDHNKTAARAPTPTQ